MASMRSDATMAHRSSVSSSVIPSSVYNCGHGDRIGLTGDSAPGVIQHCRSISLSSMDSLTTHEDISEEPRPFQNYQQHYQYSQQHQNQYQKTCQQELHQGEKRTQERAFMSGNTGVRFHGTQQQHRRYVSVQQMSPPSLLLPMDDEEDHIRAMRNQETRSYACPDYLEEQQNNRKQFGGMNQTYQKLSSTSGGGKDGRPVDEFCREQICEWSFRVVDYFNVSREVVAISMSYLDRFVARCVCDRRTYKLAATTCLYIAMKLHEPTRNLNFMGILTNLSRGEFNEHHIAEMEQKVLDALFWMVNPPIPSWFAAHLVKLRPLLAGSARPDVVRSILDLAMFYTELAVMDYYFVTKRQSLVGLAAVLEAMEDTSERDLPTEARHAFWLVVCGRVMPSLDRTELNEIRSRLRIIYERSHEATDEDMTQAKGASSPVRPDASSGREESATSPVCISRPERQGRTL